jgi:hypothetical protein
MVSKDWKTMAVITVFIRFLSRNSRPGQHEQGGSLPSFMRRLACPGEVPGRSRESRRSQLEKPAKSWLL